MNNENVMGTKPVKNVLFTMCIPMILSMVLQACYNIVDSMFVARMESGEQAVNALTLAFPVQMLIIAFSIGTGVGVNALVSKSLGQKDFKKAGKTAGNGVTLALIIYAVFLVFGILGTGFYLKTQTSDSLILEMGCQYLKICCILSFGIIVFSVYEKLLQSSGKSLYSTIAQVSGAAVNIILDPVLIFGLCGFPELKIAGAAYATVIGQIVSMIIAMAFHYKKNTEIKSLKNDYMPDSEIIKQIYSIGLPAIIMQALMSFMTYGINIILGGISASAVTAYGIYYKVQQFVYFAAFGLRDAITPLVSYNYGMKDKERVKDGIKYGVLYVTVIMVAGTLIIEAGAGVLAGMFNLSGETQRLCITASRIITIGFIFAGINIALQGVFQALDCGMSSLIVSVLRLFIIVLPLAWIFSKMAHAETMVWTSFVIAEAVAAFAAVFLLYKALKTKLGILKNVIPFKSADNAG